MTLLCQRLPLLPKVDILYHQNTLFVLGIHYRGAANSARVTSGAGNQASRFAVHKSYREAPSGGHYGSNRAIIYRRRHGEQGDKSQQNFIGATTNRSPSFPPF
ncbi:hypothetical protein CEXT_119751 [Caerostris extrusa]|uniref:Uncharacterized protein n=1 Tax=Caerostris extrusa TaxID=172846 RepID=A0AAV4U520_CAEEX|nr:hypothetical protein CEXT_119751 [Caerostris extrusa]